MKNEFVLNSTVFFFIKKFVVRALKLMLGTPNLNVEFFVSLNKKFHALFLAFQYPFRTHFNF